MRIITTLLALMALAACSNQHLGQAKGTPFALNPGHWTPTAADLAVEAD